MLSLTCPACGHDRFEERGTETDRHEQVRTLACRHCGNRSTLRVVEPERITSRVIRGP